VPDPATLAIFDDGTVPPTDEFYTYNKLGNLTSKTGKGSYSYPASGSAHPHAVTSTSDGRSYSYDANSNMTGTGGLISTYDGERVTRAFGMMTAVYLGGVWEELQLLMWRYYSLLAC
jgi:streptogramin lyase